MSKESFLTFVFIFMISQAIFSLILSTFLFKKTNNLTIPILLLMSSGFLFHSLNSYIKEQRNKSKIIVVPAKMMSGMPETKPYPKSWESNIQVGSFVLYTRKINSSAPLNPCLAKNINQRIIIESCV